MKVLELLAHGTVSLLMIAAAFLCARWKLRGAWFAAGTAFLLLVNSALSDGLNVYASWRDDMSGDYQLPHFWEDVQYEGLLEGWLDPSAGALFGIGMLMVLLRIHSLSGRNRDLLAILAGRGAGNGGSLL